MGEGRPRRLHARELRRLRRRLARARQDRRRPRRAQHALEGARGGRARSPGRRRSWRSPTGAISAPSERRPWWSRCALADFRSPCRRDGRRLRAAAARGEGPDQLHLHLRDDRPPEGRDADARRATCSPARRTRGGSASSRGSRLYACLPLLHVNAQAYSTMGAIGCGGGLVLVERFSASRFWDDIRTHRANAFNFIGAVIAILLKAEPGPHERDHELRVMYGAPAFPEAERAAIEERFGVRVISGFGMSETTFGLIEEPYGERRSGSMGKARQHPDPAFVNEARVVDDDGRRGRGRRSRGADHLEPGDHARLLRRSRADGRVAPRRLALDRRPRATRRGRLLLLRRPQEGHRPAARRERLLARGRGRPHGASRRRGGGGGRRPLRAHRGGDPRARAAPARRRGRAGRARVVVQGAARGLQGAAVRPARARAAEDLDGQAPEEAAAGRRSPIPRPGGTGRRVDAASSCCPATASAPRSRPSRAASWRGSLPTSSSRRSSSAPPRSVRPARRCPRTPSTRRWLRPPSSRARSGTRSSTPPTSAPSRGCWASARRSTST